MTMTRALSSMLLGIALTASASFAAEQASSDTQADYAYSLPLQISGKQGVVSLRLPVALYQQSRTKGLADLRVFDAQGKLQPFALYRPETKQPEQRSKLPAKIFPVKGATETGNASLDLDIRTRTDGSVVSVHTRSNEGNKASASLRSLILDFGPRSAKSALIESLRFTPAAKQVDYSAEIWLESSHDLKHWETVGAAELRWLSNGSDEKLVSDGLEFIPQAFRYARVTWRRGNPISFDAIDAETVSQSTLEPARETLWLQPAEGKKAGDLVYAANIAIPVEQVALRFSEPNIVYPVAIGHYVERPSRHTGKPTEWVFYQQASATFYQISQNDLTRRSGPIHLGGAQSAEWVLRPQTANSSGRPELGISWQPATLVFLAGGTPPYLLGFGRSDAENTAQPLALVAPNFSPQELGQLEQVQFGALQTGPGGERTAKPSGWPASGKTYILWGVLLLGVLILGLMAWKLIAQMKEEKTQSR